MGNEVTDRDVLLVVDVQNDFCDGGALAVPGGQDVVPVIHRIAGCFRHAILTQDWHPPNHHSFASHHPGRQPFETIETSHGAQMLWPDHCVQGSLGAAFHPHLQLDNTELILRKGFRPDIDSYSAFLENDHRTRTGLTAYLRERELTRIFITGLAYDVCVRYSAIHARAEGFETYVIEDACRGIDQGDSVPSAKHALREAGVHHITSAELL